MLFIYGIGAVLVLAVGCVAFGLANGLRQAQEGRTGSHTDRMRQEWEKIGVSWPKGIDPALPPPTAEDLADVESLEHYNREHLIEMHVQAIAERASAMYLKTGATIQGAREEAMRKSGAAITSQAGYEITKEVKERVMRLPAHALLNHEAMAKLERDTEALASAYKSGGLDEMTGLAKDMGMGRDLGANPLAWMEGEQKRLRAELRNEGHAQGRYKKDRQKAKDSDPWGAAKLVE